MQLQASLITIFAEESVQTLEFDPHKKLPSNQTPLHIAAREGLQERIHFLIKAGANINALDDSQRTPLFLAVIQGHKEIVQLLINQGASINGQNINHETALDLAIRYGHEDIAHLLLGTQKRLNKGNIPKSEDLDKYYEQCLLKSKKENLLEEQIYYLILISEAYLKKNYFATSACLLNSAIAVLKQGKGSMHIQEYLMARLDRIEVFLLETREITPSTHTNKMFKKRDYLTLLRNSCETDFKKGVASQVVVHRLTLGFKKLFQTLLCEAMEKIGRPPVKKWACIGMGSLARMEMCPYSDVEFAFIIDQQTPQALNYFRTLSQLLQLRIINLGETKFPIFGQEIPSPTPDGFCLDMGGNTPLGGVFELIGTPQHLAQLQTSEWISHNIILANVMSCVELIDGDTSLLITYQEEISAKQRLKEDGKQANHQLLALQLLKGHLEEFAPNLTEEKEKLKAFGIKKEFYRPIQEIINCLCLYYEIKFANTFERIDELVKIKVLSTEGADNLKEALSKALALRLEAHFFYKDEKEILSHDDQDDSILYIDQQKQLALNQIYKVLKPLHWMAEDFYKNQNKDKSRSNNLSSTGLYASGKILEWVQHYSLANQFYQEAVALNPSVDSLMQIASTEHQLGKDDRSLQHYKEALKLAISTLGKNHLKVAQCYWNIGMLTASKVNNFELIITNYFCKALNIALRNASPEGQFNAGTFYLTIATTYVGMQEYDKACTNAEYAAVIFENLLNTEYADPTHFNNVANIYLDVKDFKTAFKYHQKALDLCPEDNYAGKARAHLNLGEFYKKLKDTDRTLLHLKKSVAYYLKGPEDKIALIGSYTSLGDSYREQENYQGVLNCYKKVLKLVKFVYGKEDYRVVDALDAISVSLLHLGDHKNALKCFAVLLKLLKKKNLPKTFLANCYVGLGICYFEQGRYEISAKIYQKVIEIREKELNQNDPSLGDLYYNLGISYFYLENKEYLLFLNKAMDNYVKNSNTSRISSCKAGIACSKAIWQNKSKKKQHL